MTAQSELKISQRTPPSAAKKRATPRTMVTMPLDQELKRFMRSQPCQPTVNAGGGGAGPKRSAVVVLISLSQGLVADKAVVDVAYQCVEELRPR